jgi:hypothetical protein
MAGRQGIVSVSDATREAVHGLRGRVAPGVLDALGQLLVHGNHIALDTGWHGGDSERWHADFQARYDAIRVRVQHDLDDLCSFAETSFAQITSAGGGLR